MLHIHRAHRADILADGLRELLREPLVSPLEPDVVAVPTRGMERWLAQQLSMVLGARPGRADGVCANVTFPFPGTLVAAALAPTGGPPLAEDPWAPARAVWPLLDVIEAARGEPFLAPLARHIGWEEPTGPARGLQGGTTGEAAQVPLPGSTALAGGLAGQSAASLARRDRRFAAVRHLADLFDRYAIHRPAMVQAWAVGADHDGAGCALPEDLAWQPPLWRALRERIGVPSLAERLPAACAALRPGGGADPDLPSRVSLFGLTRLPISYLEVLAALADAREVHLWLLHPTPGPGIDRAALIAPHGVLPRRRAGAPEGQLHPLFQSWGREAREMQLVLAAALPGERPEAGDACEPGGAESEREAEGSEGSGGPVPARVLEPVGRTDERAPAGAEQLGSLLHQIQADIRANRLPPGPPPPGQPDLRRNLRDEDRSVQVHSCHSGSRQVEVLHDALLHLLADDPTLEPRDILVLCPDVETFAPLFEAVFSPVVSPVVPHGVAELAHDGTVGGHEAEGRPDNRDGEDLPVLPVQLADRSLRRTNPVVAVVAEVLELAGGRLRTSELLSLAARPPVRERFGLGADELAQLEAWARATGIRWGLDEDDRDRAGLPGVTTGTWERGLARLVLGVALSEEGLPVLGGALPLGTLDSADVEVVGHVVELLDCLKSLLASLRGPQPVREWVRALRMVADRLVALGDRDAWQRLELDALLDQVVAEASAAAGTGGTPLSLAEVQDLLADRLGAQPGRANFRTGRITVCTMVPMRSIPHRVVCLVGLDHDAFPRGGAPDGDDVLARLPVVGERDPRAEDRQLLLDALLAAQDALVVTFTGRDERQNTPLPPAVPVLELLEVIDQTARVAGGGTEARSAAGAVLVEHPLHAFDARNFEPGRYRPGVPWGFSASNLDAARARQPGRPGRVLPGREQVFLREPLPPMPPERVELEALIRFLHSPVESFLRERLKTTTASEAAGPSDRLEAGTDALAGWAAGERILADRLAGHTATRAAAAERARGLLPPGQLGDVVIEERNRFADQLLERISPILESGRRDPIDVRLTLPGGKILVGTVPGPFGSTLLFAAYQRLSPRGRLTAWAQLLAATLATGGEALDAVAYGRAPAAGSRGGRRGEQPAAWGLSPLGQEPEARRRVAAEELASLATLFEEGLCEPLPLFARTSAAWAAEILGSPSPGADAGALRHAAREAARKAWEGDGGGSPGEGAEQTNRLVFGEACPFAELLAIRATRFESGPGWEAKEPSRLGRLALRLWSGPYRYQQVRQA